jgi:hypothetical protein
LFRSGVDLQFVVGFKVFFVGVGVGFVSRGGSQGGAWR